MTHAAFSYTDETSKRNEQGTEYNISFCPVCRILSHSSYKLQSPVYLQRLLLFFHLKHPFVSFLHEPLNVQMHHVQWYPGRTPKSESWARC